MIRNHLLSFYVLLCASLYAVIPQNLPSNGRYSEPEILAKTNRYLFFKATDKVHGNELWRTDGTEEGTILVKDINPGTGDSNISSFVGSGDVLYFSAGDGVHGQEQWRSDGTERGTYLLKDIWPGSGGSMPGNNASPVSLNGKLYFLAQTQTSQMQLWSTDGTTEGTVLVKDLAPQATTSITYYSAPEMVAAGNRLYFTLLTFSNLNEVWTTDGTSEGTYHMDQFYTPYISSSYQKQLFPFGDKVCFYQTGTGGEGMCITDGNPENSTILADLRVAAAATFQGKLFFSSNSSLWVTDGTKAGTQLVKSGMGSNAAEIVADETHLWISVRDQIVTAFNDPSAALWTSDGTTAGTSLVSRLPYSYWDRVARNLTIFHQRLFFVAQHVALGKQVWTSDGTAAGTRMIGDTNLAIKDMESASNAEFAPFLSYKENLWFSMIAGESESPGLWFTLPPVDIEAAPPSVETKPEAAVKPRKAIIAGSAAFEEASGQYWFRVWGLNNNIGVDTPILESPKKKSKQSLKPKSIKCYLSHLTPGYSYYYQMAASNSDSVSYGNINSFSIPDNGTSLYDIQLETESRRVLRNAFLTRQNYTTAASDTSLTITVSTRYFRKIATINGLSLTNNSKTFHLKPGVNMFTISVYSQDTKKRTNYVLKVTRPREKI